MGRRSHHFTKRIDEMTLVIKSQHNGHIKRMNIPAQQIAGLVQAQLHMILQRRHARLSGETANKMIFTQPGHLRQYLQLWFYVEMLA